MISLFARLFVKDWEKTGDPVVRRSYGTMTSIIGIVCNLLLAAGKILTGWLFSAVSVMADGLNNLSDAGSQLISLISFKISARPADRDHPFGHARIEYVASMIVSMIVITIGVQLFRDSLDNLIHGAVPETNWIAVVVLCVSILVKLFLFALNKSGAARIGSSVMHATAVDSLSDVGATGAVLIATLIFVFTGGKVNLDAVMGMAVSVFIVIAGLKILNETKNSILGEAPSEEIVDSIKNVVAEYPGVLGIHDLTVHNYGPGRVIASLHAEVSGAVNIFETHDVIDCIERRLRTDCGIEATIHMDPIETDDAAVNLLREWTLSTVSGIDPTWRIHDFRCVKGPTHTNLIFDVAVPFETEKSEGEVRDAIAAAISGNHPEYCTVVTVDRV